MTAQENTLPDPERTVSGIFPRRRSTLKVSIDLDPVPGWGNDPTDHRELVQSLLDQRVGHYNPTVEIVELWPEVACTCGGGEGDAHYLRCAKWISVLPNHVQHDEYLRCLAQRETQQRETQTFGIMPGGPGINPDQCPMPGAGSDD